MLIKINKKQKELYKNVKFVLKALSTDVCREVLTKAYIEGSSLIATDGRRLHKFSSDYFETCKTGLYDVYITKDAVMFYYDDEYNKNHVFPRINKVVPENYEKNFKFINLFTTNLFKEVNYSKLIRELNNDSTLNYKFYLDVINFTNLVFYSKDSNNPIIFKSCDCFALIMPLRCD